LEAIQAAIQTLLALDHADAPLDAGVPAPAAAKSPLLLAVFAPYALRVLLGEDDPFGAQLGSVSLVLHWPGSGLD